MKRKALAAIMAVAMAVSMAGCEDPHQSLKILPRKQKQQILRHQRAEA